MLWNDILIIVVMLILTAALAFMVGWFMKNYKIERYEGYARALEEKINRTQEKLQLTEKLLIDCQTNRKIVEAEKDKLEQQFNIIKEVQEEKIEIPVKQEKETKELTEKKEEKQEKKKDDKKTSSKKKKTDDNLKKIEGIGPKIEGILKDAGINSYETLANQTSARISEILVAAGGNSYNRFNPETWPAQAKLAAEGKWDELNKWQDELKGGRKV